jgi:hypothetical protein
MLRSRHEQHRELGINLIDKCGQDAAVGSSIEFERIDAGEIFRARV